MEKFQKQATEVLNLIKNHKKIIIHRHINPDGDAFGSQFGLKEIINDNFPDKEVLVPGDINDHMAKFFPKPNILKAEDYQNALVIICDTANQERISGEFWRQAKIVIKIDHHPEIDNYQDVSLIDVSAAANCQIISKWAQTLKLKVSALAARYLFLGLVTDSGRFLYRSVNSETFAAASFLMTSNFNLLDLYQNLYLQDFYFSRIKGYVLSNFQVSAAGVGYLIVSHQKFVQITRLINKSMTKQGFATITLSREDLTTQVNLMSNIKDIKIWLIACQDTTKNDFKISVRSSRWIINETVQKFGGGGHNNAAGCRLKTLREVKKLLASLEEVAKLPPQIEKI